MGRVIAHLPGDKPSSSSVDITTSIPVKTRDEALKLIEQKKDIEEEMNVYMDVLTTQGVDLRTPLIDNEGYPRADIDVAAVRTARARLIHLRNDLNHITNEIALALENVLAKRDSPKPSTSEPMDVDHADDAPFALVDGVAPSSPAAEAGLRCNDRIVQFDTLNRVNHDRLQAMPGVLSKNEGHAISVKILRPLSDEPDSQLNSMVLSLTPRKWSGRGLLGCHVIPL